MKNHRQSFKALNPKSVKSAQVHMPSKGLLTVVIECFKALGDPTRAKILYALQGRSLCVRDIAVLIDMSESAVSHQLRVLRNMRLVAVEREGNTMNYSIAYEHVSSLLKEAEYFADHVRQHIPDHAHSKKQLNNKLV